MRLKKYITKVIASLMLIKYLCFIINKKKPETRIRDALGEVYATNYSNTVFGTKRIIFKACFLKRNAFVFFLTLSLAISLVHKHIHTSIYTYTPVSIRFFF